MDPPRTPEEEGALLDDILSCYDPPLSGEQLAIVRAVVLRRESVFVTGVAGSGKTTVIGALADRFFSREFGRPFLTVASTGVAADNINKKHPQLRATTLHSALKLGRGTDLRLRAEVAGMLAALRPVFILDEVSMVSAGLLDAVDALFRRIPGLAADRPFGGLQMVFMGDFCQLAPVPVAGAPMPWSDLACEADVWAELFPGFRGVHELSKTFRQRHDDFVTFLAHVRAGRTGGCGGPDCPEVCTRPGCVPGVLRRIPPADPFDRHPGPLLLAARRAVVAAHNETRLATLLAARPATRRFLAREGTMPGGDQDDLDGLRADLPVGPDLLLAEGEICYLKVNVSVEGGWVNGTRARVLAFTDEPARNTLPEWMPPGPPPGPGRHVRLARLSDGATLVLGPHAWAAVRPGADPTPLAFFAQLPLVAGYASTVHAAQGLGLDEAVLDLSGHPGQGLAYVGLSRLTDVAGARWAPGVEWQLALQAVAATRPARGLEFYQGLHRARGGAGKGKRKREESE